MPRLNSIVGIVFRATDNASRQVNRVSAAMSNFRRVGIGVQSAISGAGGAMSGFMLIASAFTVALSTATAGAAGLKAAVDIADAAASFEAEMAKIGAITQATGREFKKLENAAKEAAVASIFAPEEAARGLLALSQAGLSANEAIKSLNASLNFAAASFGQLTPQTAAGTIVGALKTFGLEAERSTEIADKLVTITTKTRLQFNELPKGLGRASKGAQVFGADLDDVIIALGLARNTMASVLRAGTSLSTTMLRLVNRKVIDRLRGFGVEIQAADGGTRRFLDIIGDMAIQLRSLSKLERKTLIQELFGTEAVAGVATIMQQLNKRAKEFEKDGVPAVEAVRKSVQELRQTMKDSEGTADDVAKRFIQSWGGLQEFIGGSVAILKFEFGKPFLDLLKPIGFAIKDVIDLLTKGLRGIPKEVKLASAAMFILVSAMLAFAGSAALLGIAVVLAIKFVIVLKVLAIAIGVVVGAIPPMIILFLTVAAIFKQMQMNSESAFGTILNFLKRVKLVAQGLFQLIAKGKIEGSLAEALLDDKGAFAALQTIFSIFAKVRNFILGVIEGIRSVIFDELDIVTIMGSILEDIKDIFQSIFNNIIVPILDIFGIKIDQNASSFATFGELVGKIIGGIITALTILIKIITTLIKIGVFFFNIFIGSFIKFLDIIFALVNGLVGIAKILIGILTLDTGLLVEGFSDLINAVVKFAATIARLLIDPIVEFLGLLGIRPKGLTEFQSTVKAFATGELTATEALTPKSSPSDRFKEAFTPAFQRGETVIIESPPEQRGMPSLPAMSQATEDGVRNALRKENFGKTNVTVEADSRQLANITIDQQAERRRRKLGGVETRVFPRNRN